MTDVTQAPEVPVETTQESSFDDRLAAKFGFGDEAPSEPVATEEPAEQPADSDELSVDEVEESEAEPKTSGDEFEIIHNGTPKKLTKEEAIALARQGFDYTQKTQAVAEERRIIEQQKQALKAQQALNEQTVEAAAAVRAIQMQLSPYQNVDWVALAQSQPNDYAAHHAQYQRLTDSLRQAQGHLMAVGQQAANVANASSELDVAAGMKRLLDYLPAWKNPETFKRDRSRILSDLQARGVDANDLNRLMSDPTVVALARDAALYREALSNRAAAKNKVKAAPAVRPGAAPVRTSVNEQKEATIKAMHQAKDPQRKAALLDQALALKFGLK